MKCKCDDNDDEKGLQCFQSHIGYLSSRGMELIGSF